MLKIRASRKIRCPAAQQFFLFILSFPPTPSGSRPPSCVLARSGLNAFKEGKRGPSNQTIQT